MKCQLLFSSKKNVNMSSAELVPREVKHHGHADQQHNHIYSMYWDRQARANSVDPDQMPQNVASDQSLHCLPLIQQFLHVSTVADLERNRVGGGEPHL